jgi:hypothetical protein
MINHHKFWLALKRVSNLAGFARDTGIPIRTLRRLRKKDNDGHKPTNSNMQRIAQGMVKCGLIKDEQELYSAPRRK